jgi:hypothetical protein
MVFDQKWWLHAYIGKTIYDLTYIFVYMYILNGFSIQVCSREIYSLILSQVMPWIDLPTGTPFLKFTQESARGFYGISLKNPAREREWSS